MRRRWTVLVVLGVLGLVILLLLPSDPNGSNRFESDLPVVDPHSGAAAAAAAATGQDRAVLERLAAVPTAVWLVPEALDEEAVAERVEELVERADDEGRVPLIVVYGITDRDCTHRESAGGLPPGEYRDWVEAIAQAGSGAVAVLEPDALATADECGVLDERIELMREAAQILHDHDLTTYVDAGHSDWKDPGRMAELVRGVGTDRLRGIAVNVANDQSDDAEQQYAESVLDDVGDDLTYVVDTGRNGAGPAGAGEFCNAPGRALGREPSAGEGRMDARLWIKPPGESDGSCGGGPPAGTFWTTGALALAANAA